MVEVGARAQAEEEEESGAKGKIEKKGNPSKSMSFNFVG